MNGEKSLLGGTFWVPGERGGASAGNRSVSRRMESRSMLSEDVRQSFQKVSEKVGSLRRSL